MDARCLIIAVLFAGCSASERIAVEANSIGERAGKIESIATRIGERSMEADTVADASVIAVEAAAIKHGVQEVHAALPGVTDKVSPIWSTLRWLAIAACGAAAVWILTASGVLGAIRAALGWIPRRKYVEADMMTATLAQDRPETVRELVAMLRAQDPLLDQAMRQIKSDSQP